MFVYVIKYALSSTVGHICNLGFFLGNNLIFNTDYNNLIQDNHWFSYDKTSGVAISTAFAQGNIKLLCTELNINMPVWT